MTTDLPIGSWIAYRHRNQTEYARVVGFRGQIGIETGGLPPIGTVIHHGIWKKDEFRARSVRTFEGEEAGQ